MLIKTSSVTNIPTAAQIIPPVSGCDALFLMGSNGNKTFNRIAGKPNPTVVGSPTDFTGYTRFTGGSHYLQTQLKESADQTVIVVTRMVGSGAAASQSGAVYGTYTNPLVNSTPANYAGGIFLYQGNGVMNAGAQRQVSNGTVESGLQSITQATNGNWALYTHEVPAASGSKFANQTTSTTLTASSTNAHLITDAYLRVGSNYGVQTGQCDIAFFASFSRILSGTEMADVLTWARGIVLAQAGITV